MRRFIVVTLLFVGCASMPAQPLRVRAAERQDVPSGSSDLRLPAKNGSLKFAVIGDTGTGDEHQYAVGQQMARARSRFPFEFVIMAGDNMYGADKPADFVKKFEKPYKQLIEEGVKFYAALGNHDNASNQVNYKPFNMGGREYYSFRPKLGVRFFALNSNYMDQKQLAWLDTELAASGSDWKIVYFHHPLYASGMHGSNMELRAVLEPLFLKYGVTVVITGHEHFYERIKPQQGIQYFVVGGSAKLRKGDIENRGLTAKGDDKDYTFMLVEIVDNQLYFQVVSDSGKSIDYGMVTRIDKTPSGRPEIKAAAGTAGKAGSEEKATAPPR